MAFHTNPKIVQDGLILNLDASDPNSRRTIREVEVMVVGGGGGGGMDMGGGGGGGGVIYEPSYKVSPGVGITVTVGAGGYGAPAGNGGYRTDGAGPQPNSHQFTISATNGEDSVFGTIKAKGGGYGASSYYGYTPNSGIGGYGASGGGCSAYTHGGERYVDDQYIPGQGFAGGNSGNPASGGDDHYSGGGGGAGGRGTSGPNHSGPNGTAGHGGPGVLISRMSPYYYGGGGGGSCYSGTKGGDGGLGGGGGGAAGGNGNTVGYGDTNGRNAGGNGGLGNNQPGGNGGANTGGGGGGGSHYSSNNKGGEGGSGIVIVRYNGPQAASGGTYTYENGVSFHTFTSSGTFTPYDSDTVWYDTSGYGHNATLYNGCTFGIVQGVPCITVDGSNDWIGNTTLPGGWSDFTMELVFYHNGTGQGGSWGLVSMGENGYYGPMFYNHTSSTYANQYFVGSPDGDYPGGSANISNLQWNVMTWVFKDTKVNSSTGSLNTYKNGVYAGQRTGYNFSNSGMGRGTNGYGLSTYTGGSAVYNGSYAIFRVYNRALSAEEVQANYLKIRNRLGF